jgi:hypothetical protein
VAELMYRAENSTTWTRVAVPDNRFVVVDRLSGRVRPRLSGRQRFEGTQRLAVPCDRLVLVRTGSIRDEAWHGLSFRGCPLLINGRPAREGLVSVPDRAELRVGRSGPAWYFSTQRAASMETLSKTPGALCPRCRAPLEQGQSVVICPRCGAVHHQDESAGRGCWLYGEAGCAGCGAPTVLGDDGGWTPDEL